MSDIVQYSRGVETEVNGVRLWYEVSGGGEPVIQIHGAGFGHYNFAPATPELSKHFRVIDYDMRGYGQSDRPVQHYDMEVWADDVAGLLDALGIGAAHVHGSSMGGMIAIVFAGKYPERTTSVVINCAAAKLGRSGRLVFQNWIDIARMDPEGPAAAPSRS
jgi:pimeloyl-ACP methyl ester carboxylesterase